MIRLIHSRSRVLHTCRDEHGQVIVLVALLMISLLGALGLVVDIGQGYLMERRAQAAADASALAAATALPNRSRAASASRYYAAKNFPRGTVQLHVSTTAAADDTADATASIRSPSLFARLFGINSLDAKATASAVAGSYTDWAAALAPWATTRQGLTFGTTDTFKVEPGDQATPGNFGAVDLPMLESGCALSNGDSDYVSLVSRAVHPCTVAFGDSLTARPGNLGSTTGQALQQLGAVPGFDPYTLLNQQPDGTYVLNTYDNPNLDVIPIIQAFPNGRSDNVVVTGFAWFIITDYTADTVTGFFVRSRAPLGAMCPTAAGASPCAVGALDPDGLTVIRLSR